MLEDLCENNSYEVFFLKRTEEEVFGEIA